MIGLIESTVYLSVTALVILLFKRIFKNKLPAKWHVWIWALLAIRLVLPSLPESSFSIFNAIDIPEKADTQVREEIDISEREKDKLIYGAAEVRTEPVKNVPDNTAVISEREQKKTGDETDINTFPAEGSSNFLNSEEAPKKGKNADFIINLVRFSGSGILFLYFIVVYIICVRRLSKNRINDGKTAELLQECKKTVGVKRRVSVIETGNCPMLVGIVKPAIILPDGYTEDEKRNIIIHELCHLKGGDIYLLWLAMIVLCLNWFNPVMWVCFFLFRRDIEVYCDERVLKYIDSKKDYAALLVKTALKKNSFIAGTTSLQNGEKEVERRVKYMAYFKKPNVWWTVVIIVIAVVIGVVCLTNPVNKNPEEASVPDIYTGFLKGIEKAEINGEEYDVFELISSDAAVDRSLYYYFLDMNGDGFDEMHIKLRTAYYIFTVRDEKISLWYEGTTYDNPTKDGRIVYIRHGGAPTHDSIKYITLDYNGKIESEVFIEQYDEDEDGNFDNFFRDGKEISADEYSSLSGQYSSKDIIFLAKWNEIKPRDVVKLWSTATGSDGLDYFYYGSKFSYSSKQDDSDIRIKYPVLYDSESMMYMDDVNLTIKDAALERYNEYSSGLFKDGFDNTSWYVDYTVAHHGKRFISIYFEGYIYTRGGAHGSDTAWTVTVDMQTGERIKLGDIFDDTFCEYVTFENFGNGAFADEEAFEHLFGTDKEDLEKAFTGESDDNFYFGDNELGINLYMYSDYYNYFTSDYESLRPCMKDHPIWEELGVKNSKVLKYSQNFLLEDRGDSYYYEVYDNNGNTLLSETSEKCPVFTHLEGPLYELQISHGTSSWECKYFNVETGYKSEAYDKPFYLDNGVIAYVNSYPKFELSKEDMYFIKLVNLYNNYEMMGYYVDYLKSSTSWIIEYVDDTHIQVTYYTENGSKENKKTIEIPSLTGALTEEDEPIVETEPKAQPEIQPEIQPEVVPKPQPEAVPELVSEADTPVVSDEIVIEADMHDVSGISDEIELETNFW